MEVDCRNILVEDSDSEISFPLLVLYPSEVSPLEENLGPFTLRWARDSEPARGRFPLLLISHGQGSLPLHYRCLAMNLARSGYVVVLPEHHRNNRNDNSLADTIENLHLRPKHVRAAFDTVLNGPLQTSVNSDRIAMIGHSMGGYTALAVAGGQPWAGMNERIEVIADRRVKAIILMAAATSWFIPNEALAEVTCPILMFTGEKDEFVQTWQAHRLLDGVPLRSRVEWRSVANAGHFSFLSPFPSALKGPHIPPSEDPEGFDREAFQKILLEEILGFIGRTI